MCSVYLIGVEVGFAQSSFMLTEGDEPLRVCVVLFGEATLTVESNVTVIVYDTAGTGMYYVYVDKFCILYLPTAMSPDDYASLFFQQLTFTSGQSPNSSADNTQCTDIPVVDDNIHEEPVEMFSLHLLSLSVSVNANSTLDTAAVSIFDNDGECNMHYVAHC